MNGLVCRSRADRVRRTVADLATGSVSFSREPCNLPAQRVVVRLHALVPTDRRLELPTETTDFPTEFDHLVAHRLDHLGRGHTSPRHILEPQVETGLPTHVPHDAIGMRRQILVKARWNGEVEADENGVVRVDFAHGSGPLEGVRVVHRHRAVGIGDIPHERLRVDPVPNRAQASDDRVQPRLRGGRSPPTVRDLEVLGAHDGNAMAVEVDEQTFNRVAEEFHHSIANSEMDSIGVLLAFAQAWVGCNAQMDLEEFGEIDTKKFIKSTKKDLKTCQELLVESIPSMLEEIIAFKRKH